MVGLYFEILQHCRILGDESYMVLENTDEKTSVFIS